MLGMINDYPPHLNPLSVAPMVDHTDRHCRVLLRLVAPKATLYTEMTVAQAIVFGDKSRVLGYSPVEQPVIAQLAGREPNLLSDAAGIVEEQGYAGVNLNVGCPSKRVKSGGFGACLMEESSRLFQIVTSMRKSIKIPLTVKCRIGTERVGGFEWLRDFVSGLAHCGVDGVVIHARIAKLDGASTSYNLNVPPLNWEVVAEVQQALPSLPLTLNGGINSLEAAKEALNYVPRMMIGRLAIHQPDQLAAIHNEIYGESVAYSVLSVVQRYSAYIRQQVQLGTPIRAMTRHMPCLFRGFPGAKNCRQTLSDHRASKLDMLRRLDEVAATLELLGALVSR